MRYINTFLFSLHCLIASAETKKSCQFSRDFKCLDFTSPDRVNRYIHEVSKWEGLFAQPGIGYDSKTGYTYDGHPLNYADGALFGEPHLFSAPSKESIHLGLLALAVAGNIHALTFVGGKDAALALLELKMKGYMQFNTSFPGLGCFHPWIMNANDGTFSPVSPGWTEPYYKLPGLDNGEIFWSLYAVAAALEATPHKALASQYRSFVNCQKENAKTIFYRGEGKVSATVYILDPFSAPHVNNYKHADGYLNDPFEGETTTQLLYLFSDWKSPEERDLLWLDKRGLFSAINFTIPAEYVPAGVHTQITVQKGWWFSTHEQWKALLLPYLSPDLPLYQRLYSNMEKARTWDAFIQKRPGLLASINDVTDGGEEIPDYISPAGVQDLAYEPVLRTDVVTPYGSFGLMMVDLPTGLCWYNTMLSGPRMQSRYGSTEAINTNGTMISPLTTWDSKITTVLAMLGGVGQLVGDSLKTEVDMVQQKMGKQRSSYAAFVEVVAREHQRVFGEGFVGDDVPFKLPSASIPTDALTDWDVAC